MNSLTDSINEFFKFAYNTHDELSETCEKWTNGNNKEISERNAAIAGAQAFCIYRMTEKFKDILKKHGFKTKKENKK